MTKDTIPQDFSLGLALFDALPVILFGMGTWLLWKMTGNGIVLAGAVICFLSGMLKVLWKIIVVIRRKNVWPLFIQMRIGMPAGFVLLIFGMILSFAARELDSFLSGLLRPMPLLFIVISAIGMMGMILCSSKLDSSDVRANWIEQGCNTVAQGAFFMSMLLAYLH